MRVFVILLVLIILIGLVVRWLRRLPPNPLPRPHTREAARSLARILTPEAVARAAPSARTWDEALIAAAQAMRPFHPEAYHVAYFVSDFGVPITRKRAQALASQQGRLFPTTDISADAVFALDALGTEGLPTF